MGEHSLRQLGRCVVEVLVIERCIRSCKGAYLTAGNEVTRVKYMERRGSLCRWYAVRDLAGNWSVPSMS